MFKIKPVKVGKEWITSTYKNFPISRLLNKKNGIKKITKKS